MLLLDLETAHDQERNLGVDIDVRLPCLDVDTEPASYLTVERRRMKPAFE